MRRFRQRSDNLEERLRDESPRPSDELVRRISTDARARNVRRAPRLGLATALSMVVVLAVALTGGIGYATAAVGGGTSALKNLVSKKDNGASSAAKAPATGNANNGNANNANGNNGNGNGNSANGQYGGKVLVCHIPPGNPGNAHTILIPPAAVPAHLAHGDTLGACQ